MEKGQEKGQMSKPVRSCGESGVRAKASAIRHPQWIEKKFVNNFLVIVLF